MSEVQLPADWCRGTVSGRPVDGIGYIQIGDIEVLFAVGDGRRIVVNGAGHPSFSDIALTEIPPRGTEVIYLRDENDAVKAFCWGLASDLPKAQG